MSTIKKLYIRYSNIILKKSRLIIRMRDKIASYFKGEPKTEETKINGLSYNFLLDYIKLEDI